MKGRLSQMLVLVVLVFTGFAVAKSNDKKNPAEYPLTAHVVSSERGTSTSFSTRSSDGTEVKGDIDSSDPTVQFRIGNLLYTAGYGCRKHVQVGTDVHARVEKNKLYILTYDGQTCDTHVRGVQELSK
jgi:hypothetical protein